MFCNDELANECSLKNSILLVMSIPSEKAQVVPGNLKTWFLMLDSPETSMILDALNKFIQFLDSGNASSLSTYLSNNSHSSFS